MAIKNQYKGKSAENVWDEWTIEQRQHFLKDHYPNINDTDPAVSINELEHESYVELPRAVKRHIELHISEGQYSLGGKIKALFNKKTKSEKYRVGYIDSKQGREHYDFYETEEEAKKAFENHKKNDSYISWEIKKDGKWVEGEFDKGQGKYEDGGEITYKKGDEIHIDEIFEAKPIWCDEEMTHKGCKIRKCFMRPYYVVVEEPVIKSEDKKIEKEIKADEKKEEKESKIKASELIVDREYSFLDEPGVILKYKEQVEVDGKKQDRYLFEVVGEKVDDEDAYLGFTSEEVEESVGDLSEEVKMKKGGKINKKKWIQNAIKHKGALRRHAKKEGLIKGDETLSETDLQKLEKEGGKTAKQAHLAETLKKY